MRVRVLFFGMLRDLAGSSGNSLDLPEGAVVRDVLDHYVKKIPSLNKSLPSLAVAVNQQYAGPETQLKSDDEAARPPPVSGGSGKEEGEPSRQPARPFDSAQGKRRRYAAIVRESIDTQGVLDRIKHAEDGAAVVFEGVVRNQTRGRKTLYLDYEAYEEMALQQMEGLAGQALAQFEVRDVELVHRLGRLEIGEISVLIVVASAHRGPAFDACRRPIDTLNELSPSGKRSISKMARCGPTGNLFRQKFLMEVLLTEAAPD